MTRIAKLPYLFFRANFIVIGVWLPVLFSIAAQAQEYDTIRNAWNAFRPSQQICINAKLQDSDVTIDQLIDLGIGPDDARLGDIISGCNSLSAEDLKQNFECTIANEGTKILSWCDQAFALLNPDGQYRQLSIDNAKILHSKGKEVLTITVEQAHAKNRREQMRAANPLETKVPQTDRGCSGTPTPTEALICNSYELTVLDLQYHDYAERVYSLPKGKVYQKKIQEIEKKLDSCALVSTCIRDVLGQAIDTFASPLKAAGISVISYSEQLALKRKQDEAAKEEQRKKDEVARQVEQAKADLERQKKETEKRFLKATQEYQVWRNEIFKHYKEARTPADIAFPPPFKDRLSEVESNSIKGDCASIGTQEQLLLAYHTVVTTNNDFVSRNCIVELAYFEADLGNTDEAMALYWKALKDAPFSSGNFFSAYTNLMDQWNSEDFVKHDAICKSILDRTALFLDAPFRERDGKALIVVAPPFSTAVNYNCYDGSKFEELLGLQKRLCQITSNSVPLNSFSEDLKGACWLPFYDLQTIRLLTKDKVNSAVKVHFETKNAELAISAPSSERRNYRDAFGQCQEAIKEYGEIDPSKLLVTIQKLEAKCRNFY